MMVGYAYGCEFFIAWYGGNDYELVCFYEQRIWTLCLGLLDNDHL